MQSCIKENRRRRGEISWRIGRVLDRSNRDNIIISSNMPASIIRRGSVAMKQSVGVPRRHRSRRGGRRLFAAADRWHLEILDSIAEEGRHQAGDLGRPILRAREANESGEVLVRLPDVKIARRREHRARRMAAAPKSGVAIAAAIAIKAAAKLARMSKSRIMLDCGTCRLL